MRRYVVDRFGRVQEGGADEFFLYTKTPKGPKPPIRYVVREHEGKWGVFEVDSTKRPAGETLLGVCESEGEAEDVARAMASGTGPRNDDETDARS